MSRAHLRATPARWFEALVPRPSIARSVEILAASRRVELERDFAEPLQPPDYSGLAEPLATYRGLRQRFADFWPAPEFRPTQHDLLLERRMERALAPLQRWSESAGAHVQGLEALRRDRHELLRLAAFLRLVRDGPPLDFTALARAHAPLSSALLVVADHAEVPEMAEAIIVARADGGGLSYLLTLGPDETIRELTQRLGGRDARPVVLPAWLSGSAREALAEVDRRIVALEQDIGREQAALAALNLRHDLAAVLGELRRLEWFAQYLQAIPVSEYLARITGWTSAAGPGELEAPLHAVGIPAVVHFPVPPPGLRAPTLTLNPQWARPFELFVRLAGTPGRNEADPTPLVALIAPLMFGYMFGDVGQGGVLLIAGLLLRRRWPVLGMLVPGGIFAMLFGLLFGSVFCRENLLPALWTAPLETPLLVLAVPMAGGGLLILLASLLKGIGERWAGRGRAWLQTDAGVALLYAGAWFSIADLRLGLGTALAGGLWYLGGSMLQARAAALRALATHAGDLIERLLQLAVNTLSFVRVGAFALAHAGLAAAVTNLEEIASGALAGVAIGLLGNVVILVLEGLVVAVQTTRLILFEFFVRFLRAEGRPFRPLRPPQAI